MRFRNITLAFLSIIFSFQIAISQDLHIYYDKQTDKVKYVYNGNEVKQPRVKKGGNVFLHVQNYNNYLYNAKVKIDNKTINPPSSAAGNPLTGLMPQGGAGNPNFNLLDIGIFKGKKALIDMLDGGGSSGDPADEDISGFVTKESEQSAEMAQLREEFANTMQELENIETEFKQIGQEVKKELDSKKVRDFALEEIDQIKRNPELTPAQIKKLSKEYFDKVFKEKAVEEVSLDEVIAMGDTPQQMKKHLQRLKQKSREYEVAASMLKGLEKRTSSLGFASADQSAFKSQLFLAYANIEEVKSAVASDMKALQELSQDESDLDLRRITALRREYEIMENNDFSQTFRAQATEDIINFDISFDRKETVDGKEEVVPVSDIEVPVAGGFKIHPSLGISFGQFFEQPEEYFVRDGQIVGSETGNFVPILTSFLHFYMQSAKGPSIGGSLGMGFPVVNTGNDQSLYFFVGPSIILGKDSKIVISGGIMGGKAKRLGAGYEVGDEFLDNSSILPTVSKYEMGYFLGLSYNLGN